MHRHNQTNSQILRRGSIYVLPTRAGLVFIAVLIAMLLGSVNHNNNFAFLLTFLLSGILFVSIFDTHQNLNKLEFKEITASPVFQNKTAYFECLIRNHGPKRCSIKFRFPGYPERLLADLAPDSISGVRVPLKPRSRGIVRPEKLRISTRYPLGLFRSWSFVAVKTDCIVYPAPATGNLRAGPLPDASGDGAAPSSGRGSMDFQGLSAYQPGDPMQHISWKAFSREQGLHVKTFADPSGEAIMLDWQNIRAADPERKLSRLCDMVLKADRFGLAYGMTIPGQHIAPARGESHKRACLKSLALFGNPEVAS